MAFDGIRKTEEPKVPDGMTPIRLVVGYNKYGNPVAGICDSNWNQEGLPEKCERDHSYSDDDEKLDNSDLIPVGNVQRIMLFMPAQAPAAQVAKAMDISNLMTDDQPPVDVQVVMPDAEGQPRYAWD